MLKKLDWVHPRMEELGMLLSDPAVVQDQEKWRALMREHSQLEPLDQAVRRYAELEDARKQAQALLDDPDMAQLAKRGWPKPSAKFSCCFCPKTRTRKRTS